MSLLHSEQLRIGVSSSRIDLVRIRRGWRAPVVARESIEYAAQPGETRAHAVGSALRRALAQSGGKRTACSIVLSNTFARYTMLPWRDEIADPVARAIYARAHLTHAYGAAAAGWELAQDRSAYGSPNAVCALDVALLDSIRTAVREAGHKLVSLQPYFSAAFNYCRARLKVREIWFAVLEPDRICLAYVTPGGLSLLRAQRLTRDLGAELASMVEREAMLMGREGAVARLYVFAPEIASELLTAPLGIDTHHFDPRPYLAPVGGDARYALALA